MGDYGFAVKKPGVNKNVLDCSAEELATSSELNCFKMAYEGVTTIHFDPAVSSVAKVSVPHALQFNPIIFAYAQLASGQWWGPSLAMATSNYVRFSYWSEPGVVAGTHQATFQIQVLPGSTYTTARDITVKYFILGDTAHEMGTTSTLPSIEDYGMKIMQPGYDAKTDNYVEHIIWSSRFPPMKIAKTFETANCPVPAGTTQTFAFPHGQSYPPVVLIWRNDGFNNHSAMPFKSTSLADTTAAEMYVTSSNLVFLEHNTNTYDQEITYDCYIFAEKASS